MSNKNDSFYAKAAEELAQGKTVKGTWSKAYSESSDLELTKRLYIKLRVENLENDYSKKVSRKKILIRILVVLLCGVLFFLDLKYPKAVSNLGVAQYFLDIKNKATQYFEQKVLETKNKAKEKNRKRCAPYKKMITDWDAFIANNFNKKALQRERRMVFMNGAAKEGFGSRAVLVWKENLRKKTRENEIKRLEIIKLIAQKGC